MVSKKTFKALGLEVKQFATVLPLAMPEALEGRGIICRKVKEGEIEMLLGFLKAGEFKLARVMVRHLLCKCGWWQLVKVCQNNLELRARVWLLFPVVWNN